MIHGIDTGFLIATEVVDHADHASARLIYSRLRTAGDRFALTPQVLAEFIHVVSDPKRFSQPLTMDAALSRAEAWWLTPEVVQLGPSLSGTDTFFTWMRAHRLGRKRILDTMLAANFHAAGINSILTTNAKDFTVLGGFHCITP